MFSAREKLRGHTSTELDGPALPRIMQASQMTLQKSTRIVNPPAALRHTTPSATTCVQSLNPHLIPAMMPPISPYEFTPDREDVQFAE